MQSAKRLKRSAEIDSNRQMKSRRIQSQPTIMGITSNVFVHVVLPFLGEVDVARLHACSIVYGCIKSSYSLLNDARHYHLLTHELITNSKLELGIDSTGFFTGLECNDDWDRHSAHPADRDMHVLVSACFGRRCNCTYERVFIRYDYTTPPKGMWDCGTEKWKVLANTPHNMYKIGEEVSVFIDSCHCEVEGLEVSAVFLCPTKKNKE
jgi:hypothetical protein